MLNRDYTAATESAVDMSVLPSVMQVRDYGKVSFQRGISYTYTYFDASARERNTPISRIKIRAGKDGELPLVGLGNHLSHKADQGNPSKNVGTVSNFM